MAGQTLGYAQRYNPLRIQSDDRTWRDTNGDNLAQEIEIGPSNNLAFGLPVLSVQPDPDGLAREYRSRDEYRHSARAVPRPVGVRLVVPALDAQRTPDGQSARYERELLARRCGQPARRTGVHGLHVGPQQTRPVQRNRLQLDGWRQAVARLQRLRARVFRPAAWRLVLRRLGVRATGQRAVRLGRQSQQLPGWRHSESDSCKSVGPPISAGATRASWTCRFDMGSSCQARTRFRSTSRSTPRLQSYDGPIRGTFWDIGPTTTYAANCIGPCRPGQLVIPNLVTAPTTAASLTLGAPGAGHRLLRPAEPARSRVPQAVPLRPIPVLGSGGHLQHHEQRLREDRDADLGHEPRQPDVEPPAAHAAAGSADAVLT